MSSKVHSVVPYLPPEIFLEIFKHLPTHQSRAALASTSRTLACYLRPKLYKLAVAADSSFRETRHRCAPWRFAIFNNILGLLRHCLDAGLPVNTSRGLPERDTLLIYAIAYGRSSIIELLLSRGADVNSTPHYTPLSVAAYSWNSLESTPAGSLACCKVLLSYGAKVNEVLDTGYVWGYAPLCAAVNSYIYDPHCGRFEVIKLLVENGARGYNGSEPDALALLMEGVVGMTKNQYLRVAKLVI